MNKYIRKQFGEGFYRILQIIRGLVTFLPLVGAVFGIFKWAERLFNKWFPTTIEQDQWWMFDSVADNRSVENILWLLITAAFLYLVITLIALGLAWIIQGFRGNNPKS